MKRDKHRCQQLSSFIVALRVCLGTSRQFFHRKKEEERFRLLSVVFLSKLLLLTDMIHSRELRGVLAVAVGAGAIGGPPRRLAAMAGSASTLFLDGGMIIDPCADTPTAKASEAAARTAISLEVCKKKVLRRGNL